MNYVEHHFGDYARDTSHLTLLEHGAYRALLDLYYVREKLLPVDCFRLVRATTNSERKAVLSVLNEFFEKTPEGWTHKRCEAEIARFREKQEKAKRSAFARWQHHSPQSDRNANASPNAMRTHSEGNAHQTPDTRHQTPEVKDESLRDLSTSPEQPDELDPTRPEPIRKANGSIPACPIEDLIEAYHSALPTLPRVRVRSSTRDRLVSARWRQAFEQGQAHTREEAMHIFREFFSHVAKSKWLTGKVPSSDRNKPPFMADLAWLMSPDNFAKTVEGRYHR